MGRVLAAITADTCGWHDSFGGVLNADEVAEKYGQGRYQELRNGFFRNGTDNLLVEMGKWNLNLQDLLMEIGRASWRERVCQYVYISVVAESLKNKNRQTSEQTAVISHRTK